YPVMALAAYAEATGHAPSLATAVAAAVTVCALQGDRGQWWWTYDVERGRIADRYPVFSVHQLGMAPAALFWLGRVAGRDFLPWIRRGARWIHDNETHTALVHWDADVVWRSVRRRGAGRPIINPILQRIAWYGFGRCNGLLPGFEINREHRPYEYGWLLFALAQAGRSEE